MNNRTLRARVGAVLLVLALCLTVLPAAAASGSMQIVYLDSADDFAAFAKSCSLDTWSQGKTFILRADISLSGVDFTPAASFGGTFEGRGHTISDFNLTENASPAGLFGTILPGGRVANLNVAGSVAAGGDKIACGGIAGENLGRIQNCAVGSGGAAVTLTTRSRTAAGAVCAVNHKGGTVRGAEIGDRVTISGSAFLLGALVGDNSGTVADAEVAQQPEYDVSASALQVGGAVGSLPLEISNDRKIKNLQLDTMLNSNDSVLNQYAKLVKMLQAYRNNNLAEAVTYYEGFDPSLFTDETVVSIANGVKQDIETNGYQTLEDLAYTMWSAGRMAEALADYQTCLAIRPANPKVIFSMGMIYRAQGETDKAVEMFTQIVTQYADSEQADKARQQLAELAPDNQQAAVPGQSIISQGETAADETAAGSGAETQAAQ